DQTGIRMLQKMTRIRQCIAFFMAICLVAPAMAPSARAITIGEEKELAEEFLETVRNRYTIVEDAMIDKYINDLGQSILSELPPQPFDYNFYVIKQDTINAFAGPAGNIFVFSGLIEAMDTESELAGILAHEIAHVSSRHISELIAESKKSQMVSMAGLIAGILVGLGGAGEVGSALSVGSLAAGQSMILAYTREREMEADYLGRKYLTQSGYSLYGLRAALQKIRDREWYGEEQVPTYLKTHPATRQRLANLDNALSGLPGRAPENTFAFDRTRAALMAKFGNPAEAAERFREELARDENNAAAQYGLALALAESGRPETALENMKHAVSMRPEDPYMAVDLGRLEFKAGKYDKAEKTLSSIENLSEHGPKGLFFRGRARMAGGKTEAAIADFKKVAEAFPDYPRALLFLGQSLGEQGKLAEAHYYLGRYYRESGELENAMFHLKRALRETGDPVLTEKIHKAQEILKDKQAKKSKQDRENRSEGPGKNFIFSQSGKTSW
ncbi:MAG: M48 family metalloprotease, partial [Desulfobacterales bacterium]